MLNDDLTCVKRGWLIWLWYYSERLSLDAEN
jgi:hypothetical protein